MGVSTMEVNRMLPMSALRLSLGNALAEGAILSQPANAMIVRLIIAPFAESENLVVGDLTFADFDGSTGLDVALDDQQVGVDPVTGLQRVTLIEPLGGWRWETTGVTNLPQNVYGAALLSNASAALLAVMTLITPVTLDAVGQEINLGTLSFTFVPQPLS